MKNLNRLSVLLLSLIFLACGGSGRKGADSSYGEVDFKGDMKLKQYYTQGIDLYTTYCANCHQEDGSGLGRLFPPLTKSDYLMSKPAESACAIRNGMHKEIEVNGQMYNQLMPANEDLTALQIAEILAFISHAWGNEGQFADVKQVEKWLRECDQ